MLNPKEKARRRRNSYSIMRKFILLSCSHLTTLLIKMQKKRLRTSQKYKSKLLFYNSFCKEVNQFLVILRRIKLLYRIILGLRVNWK